MRACVRPFVCYVYACTSLARLTRGYPHPSALDELREAQISVYIRNTHADRAALFIHVQVGLGGGGGQDTKRPAEVPCYNPRTLLKELCRVFKLSRPYVQKQKQKNKYPRCIAMSMLMRQAPFASVHSGFVARACIRACAWICARV